jgi:hypothetical protein
LRCHPEKSGKFFFDNNETCRSFVVPSLGAVAQLVEFAAFTVKGVSGGTKRVLKVFQKKFLNPLDPDKPDSMFVVRLNKAHRISVVVLSEKTGSKLPRARLRFHIQNVYSVNVSASHLGSTFQLFHVL